MDFNFIDVQTRAKYHILSRGFAFSAPQKDQKQGKQKRQRGQGKQAREPVHIESIDDGLFGDLRLIQSAFKTTRKWTEIKELSPSKAGQAVWVRARVHNKTGKGKSSFLVLRQGVHSVQGAMFVPDVPREMVKFSARIPKESIVDIYADVSVPPDPIKAATQSNCELKIKRLYVISCSAPELPFQIADASRVGSEPVMFAKEKGENKAEEKKEESRKKGKKDEKFVTVSTNQRLNYRWLDSRTAAKHGIFRISSGVCQFYREFLLREGFIEIHTPKIIPGVSEGGSEVFRLNYFGGKACLAQSPQLYKQMAITSDFGRVFEIAPVFRAENSMTLRHMTEFTGLDFEMEIKEHYDEVLDVLGRMFVYIFDNLSEHFQAEIAAVNAQYPFEPLKYSTHPLTLRFRKCVEMLQEVQAKMIASGASSEEIKEAGANVKPEADFSTANEKLLGKLIKEQFGEEFYIVDKYPVHARPFYSMPCRSDPSLSNAYDAFVRGEEIASGAQRVHDPVILTQRARECEVPLKGLQKYIESFQHGACPHGGAGIGLERVVMLFLGLPNVRYASLFPRDPRRCSP